MSISNQLLRRYPGVKPFETADKNLFFGREKDIEDLLDLIWLEKLVVLFGKSGYGKSSLINAGILPEIEQEAVPIVVRLGSYVAGQNPSPLDNLKRKIDEVLSDNLEANFIQSLNVPKTLWHQMKNKQSRRQRRFVLIFDQFEEFFTYPIAEQQAFKEQIADLLYTEVPQAVRDLNDTLTEEQQAFIATPSLPSFKNGMN
jgi:energy-coupling factor transporter ATP-binding protein EcfA2